VGDEEVDMDIDQDFSPARYARGGFFQNLLKFYVREPETSFHHHPVQNRINPKVYAMHCGMMNLFKR
jgi:hypothetical protein